MTFKVEITTTVTGGPLCGGPRTGVLQEHTLLSALTPNGFGPASLHFFGLFVPVTFFPLHLSI